MAAVEQPGQGIERGQVSGEVLRAVADQSAEDCGLLRDQQPVVFESLFHSMNSVPLQRAVAALVGAECSGTPFVGLATAHPSSRHDLLPLLGTGALLVLSAMFSSVTDNIPLAAMLAKILAAAGTSPDSSLWWSVVFGANLGGNLTPIGSASTLVAVTIIHKNNIQMSFIGFVKVAVPFAIAQILLALLYVLVFLY